VSLPAGSTTPVVYGLTVSNAAGALATTAPVTITDAIPTGTTYVAGSVSCVTGGSVSCTKSESGGSVSYTIGSGLAGGSSYEVTFAVTPNASDPAETIPNTAYWTGPDCSPTAPATTCPTNMVPFTVTNNAAVTVVKTANTSSVTAGQAAPVVYTLTVHNPGPSDALSGVTISDVVPAGAHRAAPTSTTRRPTPSPSIWPRAWPPGRLKP
jgi:uncharacterized repeat protein (TIGR01451 family)